jgi:hypothetical protein
MSSTSNLTFYQGANLLSPPPLPPPPSPPILLQLNSWACRIESSHLYLVLQSGDDKLLLFEMWSKRKEQEEKEEKEEEEEEEEEVEEGR